MVALEVLGLPEAHDVQRCTNGSCAGAAEKLLQVAPGREAIGVLRKVARRGSAGVASWLVGIASSPLCGGLAMIVPYPFFLSPIGQSRALGTTVNKQGMGTRNSWAS
jgi:hypothetical protein